MKRTYDMRGRMTNLLRLVPFDKEAFVHMVFYRALVFAAIAYGIVGALFLLGAAQLAAYVKPLALIVWVLVTPQVFETVKAFSLVATRGAAFGRLNEGSTKAVRRKTGGALGLFYSLPYAVLAVWVAGFLAALAWWAV